MEQLATAYGGEHKPALTDKGNRQYQLTESDFRNRCRSVYSVPCLRDGGGEPVLLNINLTLQAGQTLGIIGGTTCSSVVLIPRLFLDTETGSVSCLLSRRQ